MPNLFEPFSSTEAAKKMGYGSHSHTHTHTAGPFSILAIKDAWGQIKVNVEEFPIFWEMILLQEGFFHDHFDICPNLEKSNVFSIRKLLLLYHGCMLQKWPYLVLW